MNKKHLLKALAKAVGRKDVLASLPDLIAYSYDATGKRSLPDVIVFPNSTTEISAIMKIAHQEHVPVIARGAGTNLSGGTISSQGGIVLELSRLNRILDIDTAGRRVVVEPGVVNLDLQNALQPLGFMYAPDPASQKSCTLGGNAGEDAGGPRCLKYGVNSNHICELELVLANGQVVQVGTANDESYGYDLLGPVVGSEGTLGIITKLVLRIMRLPESFQTMLVTFGTLDDAGQAVSDIIASGIVPGALELLDNTVVKAIEASFHVGYPEDAEALLLIELDGVTEGLNQQAERIVEICNTNSAQEVKLARTIAEREGLWQGRRGVFGAIARVRPTLVVQDATVPRNKLVPMLREVNKIAQKHKLLVGNVAHLGDGNLHPLLMYDNRDPEESERAVKAGKEILAACVNLEGTISGEHGIGLEKQDSMPLMFSHAELELMHLVKNVFDPEEILNPGKIAPFEKMKPLEVTGSKAISTSPSDKGKVLYDELVEILGKNKVLIDPYKLDAYQVDNKSPHLAVFPANTEHVCEVIRTANLHAMTLILWGNGSKQAIGPPLTEMGTVLSLKNMHRLLELDTPNLTARVEAGMNHAELQKELAKHGLLFPLEPADIESATIGGSLATNSNGPKRLLYGTTRDLVLGITAVTPTGEVIRIGGKTMKNVAGYDLRKLFLGSWGTLGVITDAILRLFYLPEEHKTMLLKFQNIGSLSQIVRQISNSFLRPESMELIDAIATQWLNSLNTFKLQENELLLLIGLAGTTEVVNRHITEIQTLAAANNNKIVAILNDTEENEIWDNQRYIQRSLPYPESGTIKGKAVVPSHRMRDMYQDIQQATIRHGLQVGITGHAGNGILYPTLFSKNHDTQHNEMLALVAELIQSANKLGGFFLVESGPPEIRQAYDIVSQRSDYGLMKRLKQTLDPQNILNPGKVIRNL